MKKSFKIIHNGNPIQLEVGRDVLDMTIRISSYINNNFTASDFFTIGNTSHDEVVMFLEILEEAQGRMKLEDDKITISIKRYQYSMLQDVLWYGSNFGDDIPELEPFHDDIWDMYDALRTKK